MVGEPELSLALAAIGIPFAVMGVVWLFARLLFGGDGDDEERSVPEPNRQGRSIPGTGN